LEYIKKEKNTAEVVICPPSLFLELASDQANDTMLMIGAQNMSCNEFGANTGEISAPMLDSMGI
jgi:triosephosphate isomerase